MIKILFLIFILVFNNLWAAEAPSQVMTGEEAVKDEKAVKKVWKNVLKGYQQARNTAKFVVAEMRLVAGFAYDMENMLISWERVAQTTELLLSKKTWSQIATNNPVTLIENLEEQFFRPTDKLLFQSIPNAMDHSRAYEASRQAWIAGPDGAHGPAIAKAKEKMEYLLKLSGLSEFQKEQVSREKLEHEYGSKLLATTSAKSAVNLNEALNNEAQLDNFQKQISNAGEQSLQNEEAGLTALYQVGDRQAQNSYILSGREISEKLNSLELLTHIQSTKASRYSKANNFSYMFLFPLTSLSQELEKMAKEAEK